MLSLSTWCQGLWGCTMLYTLASARLWLAAATSARSGTSVLVPDSVAAAPAAPPDRRNQQLVGNLSCDHRPPNETPARGAARCSSRVLTAVVDMDQATV